MVYRLASVFPPNGQIADRMALSTKQGKHGHVAHTHRILCDKVSILLLMKAVIE